MKIISHSTKQSIGYKEIGHKEIIQKYSGQYTHKNPKILSK